MMRKRRLIAAESASGTFSPMGKWSAAQIAYRKRLIRPFSKTGGYSIFDMKPFCAILQTIKKISHYLIIKNKMGSGVLIK
jgi:hypothetical protein